MGLWVVDTLERFRKDRIGGLSVWSLSVFAAFMVALTVFVLLMPVGFALHLFPDEAVVSDLELALLGPLGALLIAPVGFITVRICGSGVRVDPERVEIYNFRPKRVVERREVRRMSLTDDGVWAYLETRSGEKINLFGINLLGPGTWRKRRAIEKLNSQLAELR